MEAGICWETQSDQLPFIRMEYEFDSYLNIVRQNGIAVQQVENVVQILEKAARLRTCIKSSEISDLLEEFAEYLRMKTENMNSSPHC